MVPLETDAELAEAGGYVTPAHATAAPAAPQQLAVSLAAFLERLMPPARPVVIKPRMHRLPAHAKGRRHCLHRAKRHVDQYAHRYLPAQLMLGRPPARTSLAGSTISGRTLNLLDLPAPRRQALRTLAAGLAHANQVAIDRARMHAKHPGGAPLRCAGAPRIACVSFACGTGSQPFAARHRAGSTSPPRGSQPLALAC